MYVQVAVQPLSTPEAMGGIDVGGVVLWARTTVANKSMRQQKGSPILFIRLSPGIRYVRYRPWWLLLLVVRRVHYVRYRRLLLVRVATDRVARERLDSRDELVRAVRREHELGQRLYGVR